MTIQTVNLGTYANSSTGDDLRTAFEKVNANFEFLDLTSAVDAVNLGSGVGVYSSKSGDNLQLKSLVSGTDMVITSTSSQITLSSLIDITRDTAPALGGNLVLNSFNITGTGSVNITGSMTSTGDTVVGGDVAVNGGDLTTTATTFNLVNTTATTVNLAAAANFLNIGKTTGLTTVAGELQVNDDVVITNNGRLKTTNSSAYVFNEVANYVFMGQAAIRVDIGNASGLTVFGNNIDITGDAIVRQNLTVDGSITVNTVTDLIIPGGSNGYLLSTDGLGELNWIPPFSGDVFGPASATDNAIMRFNGTTGKLSQNSLVTVSDTGAITAPSVGSVIPFYYANQAAFPSAATYHGALAHSHADGKMYFAHSGAWAALANASDAYVLPTATTSVLGGVKVDGSTVTINGSGVITANYTTYSLPTATTSVLGGVRVDGTTITISGGIISSSGSGGSGNLDFGTFSSPAGFTLDLGSF
jgi:hypothetical protein